jgi:acetyl esterase/lipase
MNKTKNTGAAVAERPVTRGALVVDPVVSSFLDALAAKDGQPIYQLPYQDARKVLDDLQSGPIEKPQARIEDINVPGGPTGEISLRIVRPANAVGKLRPVIYFHGGGWILGDKNTHDRLVREIATGANASVVFVNFTPSPEAKFPVPIEQAYSATKYIAEHGSDHAIDSSRLVIAGDSVGGNMATVVAMLAKERSGPKIDYQLLLYPVTDATMNTPSYRQFANGPWLTKAAMAWFWNAYAPDGAARTNPLMSPLMASSDQLKGLPPALVITDENDVLRDEGEAYARKLLEAGITVTAVRFLATIHDFMMLNPLASSPATRHAVALANAQLRNALAG